MFIFVFICSSASGISHHAFCADVSASGSVEDVLQNVKSAFSSLPTVAVNSAGITKDTMMLKMSEDYFDKVLDVNLKASHIKGLHLSKLVLCSAKCSLQLEIFCFALFL